ncbi:transglutaminase family protein [uncultured Sphingomonas sp.]|uniref:transglutaminase-like domain-containing protein n=1 Tax=uncultured Sphingomonas sp. TaxID=158754 RepID=UPI0025F45727|nr:transglutaminase family protein [uncultured Sphingomonas sp.]
MRLSIDVTLDYVLTDPSDILLQVEVAATADQRLEQQSLTIWSDHGVTAVVGEDGIGQRCWVRADHGLIARYAAIVAVDRPVVRLETLAASPARALGGALIPYLLPSRYCESDRLEGFVRQRFAGLSGGALAAALLDWVATRLTYKSGSSSGVTTALDTFGMRSGVCRDYTHLLVALARAAEIPARCVSAYAPGVDPPDFHAVAELWLEGAWHLVDATGMARADEIAKVCVGRDATDIAFMTVFGEAQLCDQRVSVKRLD